MVILYGVLYDNIENEENTYTIGYNYELSEAEESLLKDTNLEFKKYDSKEKLKEEYDKKNIIAYITKENDVYTINVNTSDTTGMSVGSFIEAYFETYDQYLRAGNIYIFNDIIFIIPNSSDSVKKIVFVNGYYYLLTTSCLIYKLDEKFKLVTTIDLTKISSDISKTNIFSAGNMLIIQSDKTYVTDAESIKNNYGILDTDVTIDSVKVNTKTIVKILNK